MGKANTHHEDVRASVRKAGTTLSELAELADLHVTSISHSLRRPIPAANRAIAQFLGTTPQALWPEWYDETGNRKTAARDASRNRGLRNPEIAKQGKAA